MSHIEYVRSLRHHQDAAPPPMGAARIPDESLTVDGAPLKIQSKFTVADARKCSTTSFGRLHKTKVASACPRGTSLTHPDVSRIPTSPNRCSSNAQTEHPSPRQQQLHEPRGPTHHQHWKDPVSVSLRDGAPPTVGDAFFEDGYRDNDDAPPVVGAFFEEDDDDHVAVASLFSLVPGLSSSRASIPTPEVSLTQEDHNLTPEFQEDPWQHLRRPFREDLDEGQQRKVLQELRKERYKLWLERSKFGPHPRRWTRREQGFVLAFLVVEAHAYQRLQKENPQAQRSPMPFELPPHPPPPRTSVQLETPDDEASSSRTSSSSARASAPNSPGSSRSLRTPEDNPLNYASGQVDVMGNPVPPPTRDMMPVPVRRPNVNLGDRQTSAFLVHDIFVLVVDQPPQGGDANKPYDDVRVQLQSLYLWYVEK